MEDEEVEEKRSNAILRGVTRVFGMAIDGLVYGIYAAEGFVQRVARSERLHRALRPLRTGVRVAVLAALVALIVVGAGALCFERVPPATIAVKQKNWGSSSGIVPRDYRSGFHFGPKGFDRWHYLDARTHFLRFAWKSERGDHPVLEVRTKEGNTAQVAVTVPYRIQAGGANQIVADGIKGAYRHRVRATAEKVLLQELAELTSGEFADPARRQAVASTALGKLNELLDDYHVEAEAVLISGVFFPPTYEKKLQERQLESQSRLTAASLAKRHERKIEGDMIEQGIAREEEVLVAEWDRKIEEERIRLSQAILTKQRATEEYERTKKFQANAAYSNLVTDGDLALARAEAERDKLRNEALETTGGRLYLAREAASNLRFGGVTLNSNDPRVPSILDLDSMVALLVGAGD